MLREGLAEEHEEEEDDTEEDEQAKVRRSTQGRGRQEGKNIETGNKASATYTQYGL